MHARLRVSIFLHKKGWFLWRRRIVYSHPALHHSPTHSPDMTKPGHGKSVFPVTHTHARPRSVHGVRPPPRRRHLRKLLCTAITIHATIMRPRCGKVRRKQQLHFSCRSRTSVLHARFIYLPSSRPPLVEQIEQCAFGTSLIAGHWLSNVFVSFHVLAE